MNSPRESERLRRIDAITDAALTHLDVPDLLVELLERVREIFEVDTAAVLLLDEATGHLVATAASGIEEEVRQGKSVPLGEGFAGRIAADVAPVVVEDVDHSDVLNPILREHGIASLVGVPLVVESRVIGVLHMGSVAPRRFAPEDIEFVQIVGDRIALAVEARRSNVERAAATALQRSLIPERLPLIPGLRLAGRYLPAGAGGVGGDWYDVFVLPTGRVGVVMGDVLGRGLPAAVVMGRLRSALRAYALETTDPAEVLERLDRKLQHFEAGQMTTALYALIEPDLASLSVSSAGHPLPLVSTPGSDVTTIADLSSVDPPLGVDTGVRRRAITVDLPPGAVLALYTDGLVERRDEPITEGIERLRASLNTGSAEERCANAIETMLGGAEPHDDVALLVIEREDSELPPLEITVPAVATALVLVRTAMRRWLSKLGIDGDEEYNVMLGVGEAMANVVSHAYGPSGGTIEVAMTSTPHDIVATIRDTGRWRLPRGKNRGRGLTIMEKCADEVTVDTTETGTEVRLRFRLRGAPG